MCLSLNKESARLRKNFRRRKGPIIVYKSLYNKGLSKYKSEYRNFYYKLGENISDRKDIELTDKEIEYQAIFKGFHFFLNKDDITNLNNYSIYKFEIDPKDIIGVGDFHGFYTHDSLVVTKARLIGKA